MSIIVTAGPVTTLDELFREEEARMFAKREAMTPEERQRERDEDAASVKRMKEEYRRMRKARAIEKTNRRKNTEEL